MTSALAQLPQPIAVTAPLPPFPGHIGYSLWQEALHSHLFITLLAIPSRQALASTWPPTRQLPAAPLNGHIVPPVHIHQLPFRFKTAYFKNSAFFSGHGLLDTLLFSLSFSRVRLPTV